MVLLIVLPLTACLLAMPLVMPREVQLPTALWLQFMVIWPAFSIMAQARVLSLTAGPDSLRPATRRAFLRETGLAMAVNAMQLWLGLLAGSAVVAAVWHPQLLARSET